MCNHTLTRSDISKIFTKEDFTKELNGVEELYDKIKYPSNKYIQLHIV